MNHTRFLVSLVILLGGLSVVALPAQAVVESHVITIDSSTTQPIATGLVPSEFGYLAIFAEGAVQPFFSSSRYTEGYFGPGGETRLSRVGQPVTAGMPYGALIGAFGPQPVSTYQFLGDCGVIDISTGSVGEELFLALNMSDADLAGILGSLTVTVVYMTDDAFESTELNLDASSADLVGTGFIAEAGDRYITLALGGARVLPFSHPTNYWFGPAGQLRLNRVGQPLPEGPFGGLYASYTTQAAGFYLGAEGTWRAAASDEGSELSVFLNMSASDRASMQGLIKVWVIRVPDPALSNVGEGATNAQAVRSYPNPMSNSAEIDFSLASRSETLLRIYDASGRFVSTLIDDVLPAGGHHASWNGRTADGERAASGTYFYQLSTPEGSTTGRIVVAR